MTMGNYDSWKAREPDYDYAEPVGECDCCNRFLAALKRLDDFLNRIAQRVGAPRAAPETAVRALGGGGVLPQ